MALYPGWISTREAAKIIGVTPAKVAEYCRTAHMPCARGGGRIWHIRREAARDKRFALTDGETRPMPGQLEKTP